MKFNIPPFNDKLANLSGLMSNSWQNFLSIMTNNLNQYLGDLGWIFPSVSNSTVQSISSTQLKSILYNSDNNRLEMNNSGQFQAIASVSVNTTAQIQTEAVKPENIGRIYVNSDNNSLQFSLDGQNIRTVAST